MYEFSATELKSIKKQNSKVHLAFSTNIHEPLAIQVSVNLNVINETAGIILGAVTLIGMYLLIIFDVVHRTFAAMLASTMALALLAAFNQRPTMSEIMTWVDVETLLLLFSMMILVAIVSQTGFFDFIAVYAYKVN